MAAALPAFQQTIDLGPSPSRESELEELCHRQAEQIERMQALITEQAEQIGLLRNGIVRLQKQFEDLEYRVTLDIALDRQRIKKLELPEQMQPKQKDRADMLRLLLAANNGKMLSKDARHRLGLSESQFSQLLKTLKGLVEVRPFHLDGRQNVITLTKALTNDGV
jgi:predicted RNase H-like nuclease (RuvC/YqgF family)